jgi:hypothetical protein
MNVAGTTTISATIRTEIVAERLGLLSLTSIAQWAEAHKTAAQVPK